MNLTNHFSLQELTNSATAKRLKIDNTPNDSIIKELQEVANMLEKIRIVYGKPIIVTSGYRCTKLNNAVGGSKTSQHVKGQAADIRTISDLPEDNKKLFDLIVEMGKQNQIKWGQLIDEYNYNWIHISTPKLKTNNQILHIK